MLFLFELRHLVRERGTWVLMLIFGAALAYGMWNGAIVAERNRTTNLEFEEGVEDFRKQLRTYLAQGPNPRLTLWAANQENGARAFLPAAPMPLLATGQSDLSPGHETFVLLKMNTAAGGRPELANPSHLLTGTFDLAFALVWLFPLLLLALLFDLMAGDRESGTLRLALSQGMTPWRWMLRRAVARSLPMLALAVIATFVATYVGASNDSPSRQLLAMGIVLSYGLFWVVLAMAVNVVARSAAESATTLGAAWVAFVLVAPTLLNVAVESLYPTPSRPQLVAEARHAAAEAREQADLMDSFYKDHPELAPKDKAMSYFAVSLTAEEKAGEAIAPVRESFDEQLEQQQIAVGRWRFVSPAIVMQEALTDLAGTGYWRYRAFREQVGEFKQEVSEFYAPKIHRSESLTLGDLNGFPAFTYKEEPSVAWQKRVGIGIGGILALVFVLGAGAMFLLRPSRMGWMAT
jgi:ABC-2 type transport system permease protein